MDLNKFSSPLEEMELPDTYFIGHYGFTVAGIREELGNIKDEITAFNYLIRKRDRLISLNQNLEPYSFSKFYNFSSFEFVVQEVSDTNIEKKESFQEAQSKYNKFIKSINLNEINDSIVKTIIEDIKGSRYNTDILSIQSELIGFIQWLDHVIRKISIIIDFSDYQGNDEVNESDEKIMWLKKKEDFVALFDKLNELGFLSFKKNKDQLIAKHFIWLDGEIDSTKLRHVRNNIKNKKETHQISDELKNLKFD